MPDTSLVWMSSGHGLKESEALLVEAALIDSLDGLTNAAEGHGAQQGRKRTEPPLRRR